ncbi:MAG: phosphotransferase [Firmicutes bacterium]|nr:phosphotransferase [Bacillota bacterium]
MRDLLEKWDPELTQATISPVTDAAWRVEFGDTAYILKYRSTRTRVWEEYDLLNWLLENGQPISPLLYTREGTPWAEHQGGFYVLYSFVEGTPGNELPRFDSAIAKEAGVALARLHQGLAAYGHSEAFPVFDLFHEVATYAWPTVQGYATTKFLHSMHDLEQAIGGEMINPYEALPRQLIHRDFHPGNLVFQQERVVGILDFDRVRMGIRLFDLCYLVTAILSEMFPDPRLRNEWLSVVQALIEGYGSVQRLEKTEGYSFLFIVYLIQVLFSSYYLDAGNTEMADLNMAMLLWINDQHDFLQPLIEKIVAG